MIWKIFDNSRSLYVQADSFDEALAAARTVRKSYYGGQVVDPDMTDWKEIHGAMTAPVGYVWYHNSKSIFSGEYKHALLKKTLN